MRVEEICNVRNRFIKEKDKTTNISNYNWRAQWYDLEKKNR